MSSSNPNFNKGGDDEDDDKDEQPLFSLPIQSPLPPPTNLLADYQQHPPILLSPHESVLYDQDYMNDWLFSDYGIDYPIFGESSTSIDLVSSHSGTDTTNVDATRDNIAVHHQHQYEDNQPYSHDQQVGGLLVHQSGGGETSASPINKMKKKMDHNAKERVRRLQQNATYLTLRSMLPDTPKPKEKWSAPYIIDRTLDHIPQLEGEIETLKSKKKGMQLEMEKIHIPPETDQALSRSVTVSINELSRGEVIIQICHQKHKEDDFSGLIQKLEEVGLEILGFSTQEPCNERSCYHIHAQRDENSVDGDYFAVLKDKIVLWLS